MLFKVLQVGKFFPFRGGIERVMGDLAIGLNNSNVHCDILCVDRGDSENDKYDNKVLVNHIFLCKKNMEISGTMISIEMITKLRSICHDYDIIHIHHPDPMAALALFFSGYKGKVVLHWHSDIVRQKKLLVLYKPLQMWLIKRADIILGTTPTYVKKSPFLERFQFKTDYLPIGIDPIHSDSNLVKSIRQKYVNKKIIYSVGRFVSYKGFEYLIDAARDFDDNTILLIGGKGPLLSKFQNMIDSNKLSNKVKLLGFLTEIEKSSYFEACDIFCLSSVLKTEAYAIVQVEAMSCSKPVISTNIPNSGVSWVNKHGESGIIVEPRDAKSMSNAIQNLIKDVSLYDKLSLGAKKRYDKLFKKDTMIKNILSIYNSLLWNGI